MLRVEKKSKQCNIVDIGETGIRLWVRIVGHRKQETRSGFITSGSEFHKSAFPDHAGELKASPNARNISTQHLATLLGTTCCIRFATLLRYVATCWMMLDQI